MINSQDISLLHPTLQELCKKHIALCAAEGIKIIVTSTYRDMEAQSALYAQGRTRPGIIVTHAKAGESYHNFKLAYDVVPIVDGKAMWDTKNPIWKRVGTLGQSLGLEWGGSWATFKDYPHFQYTKGLTLTDLRAGKTLQIPTASNIA